MKIRACRESDVPRLKELLARHGFEYEFPALSAFSIAEVAVDEEDQVVAVAAARPTVEIFWLHDTSWRTPKWRFEVMRLLHEHLRKMLLAAGISQAHAWLPPTIAKTFGRRLRKSFRWFPSPWPCWERASAAIKEIGEK
jgi:hypothetical protein